MSNSKKSDRNTNEDVLRLLVDSTVSFRFLSSPFFSPFSIAFNPTWILIIGVSAHTIFDRNDFLNYEKLSLSTTPVENKVTAVVAGQGDIEVKLVAGEHHRKAKTKNVLRVRELDYFYCLFSRLHGKGFRLASIHRKPMFHSTSLSLLWEQ